jgi:hypothetical protein
MVPGSVNLNTALAIGKVDPGELSSVLLMHFGYGNSGISREVHFFRRNPPGKITLNYHEGEIASADGFELSPQEIRLLADRVKRELIEGLGVVAARCILLSPSWSLCGTRKVLAPVLGSDQATFLLQIG